MHLGAGTYHPWDVLALGQAIGMSGLTWAMQSGDKCNTSSDSKVPEERPHGGEDDQKPRQDGREPPVSGGDPGGDGDDLCGG